MSERRLGWKAYFGSMDLLGTVLTGFLLLWVAAGVIAALWALADILILSHI